MTTVSDDTDSGDEITLAGQDLEELLAPVYERIEQLQNLAMKTAADLNEVPAGGPLCWRYLDADATRDLFEQLRDWVDWLAGRYLLNMRLPACWYRHPVAVEELTALWVSWQAAYPANEVAPSDALIAWHDRWFWPCIDRLVRLNVFNQCGGKHTEATDRTMLSDLDEFAVFLDDECASRPEPRTADEIHAALDSGAARRLIEDDPMTPVLQDGQWWAIPVGSESGSWVLQSPASARRLQIMLERRGNRP